MITFDDVIVRPFTAADTLLLNHHFLSEAYSNGKTWEGVDQYEVRCGIAGQIKAAQLLAVDPFADNAPGYDFVIEGRRVDAKTFAVRASGMVSLQWSAIVHEDDFRKSDVDEYLFCAVNLDLKRWWGVGHLARTDFKQIADRYMAGDRFSSGGLVRKDCWAVRYESLYSLLTANWWRSF